MKATRRIHYFAVEDSHGNFDETIVHDDNLDDTVVLENFQDKDGNHVHFESKASRIHEWCNIHRFKYMYGTENVDITVSQILY